MMPDRDQEIVRQRGQYAFQSFAMEDRFAVYTALQPVALDALPELDLLILEWRWQIPGINTPDAKESTFYQPDWEIQQHLIGHYCQKQTKIVVFDLDYKMQPSDEGLVDFVLEPGFQRGPDHHVELPFDFEHIHDFPILPTAPSPYIV
jgi:hypothetical protein